ncbi:UNVERIFIED_CONTAM: hypothetical protein K2H54_057708 [Gekko kuhli]
MGHKEKCIAVSIEACDGAEGSVSPSPTDNLLWSPLAEEKFAEIVKEAHLVALQLQSGSKTKRPHANQVGGQRHESVEKFVQESKSKLKMFEIGIKAGRTPRAIKRETYCVWESPVSQLPPSFQKHSKQLVQVMDNLHSPLMPQKVSSPRKDKFPKSSIRQVAQWCVDKDNKKSSKLQTVKTSHVFGNSLAVEQSEQDSPYHPSSRKHVKSMGSLEDLLSSKSSIIPDAKDSSVVQDKRSLLTPGKRSIKTVQLKPPNDVQMRRNTLSSSSSSLSSMNSSLNSSLSISPKRGKGAAASPDPLVPLGHFAAKEEEKEVATFPSARRPVLHGGDGDLTYNVAASPPVKQLEEWTVLNSCSSIKSIPTPANIKRSGLPTPLGRRMSGIPARTPKTAPRSTSSPNLLPVRQVSSTVSKKASAASSKRVKESNVQAADSSSTSSTEGDSFPPQAVSVTLDFSPEKAPSLKQGLTENKKLSEEIQAKEDLLIDIGIGTAPIDPPDFENKPLIDFFNTPEMIKALPLKLTEQLVDLGSPLIYLSPEGNKENLDSPLLKF